ncbi:putative laccase [Helianthus anomalus]
MTIITIYSHRLINTFWVTHECPSNKMGCDQLFRNGIQQRLNSWQDGVSGTNCPIQPGFNWTYVFTLKDQIGTFSYFPSINFHKAGGAFGPIRVNNRVVIPVPFPKPHGEFDLLVGDWYNESFKVKSHTYTLTHYIV